MLRIEVTPKEARVDEEVRIRVSRVASGVAVRIKARMTDDFGRVWESQSIFSADGEGTVDVSRQAPVEDAPPRDLRGPRDGTRNSSYHGVDAMGLFWSMALDPAAVGGRDLYLKKELTPQAVTLTAGIVGGADCASVELLRHFVPPGTIVRALDAAEPEEEGLCGLYFLPPENERMPVPRRTLPVVITLGGSGGGLDWETAAALAGHGYATLALPYFGFEPLPRSLNSVPLEYFEGALRWLARRPEVDPRRIAVHGISRGGELALLLAARFPEICAVVSVVPGSVVWQGTGKSRDRRAAVSTWTFRGKELPFVPYRMFPFRLKQAFRVMALRRAVEFLPLHRASLRDRVAVERAAIPVEQIGGPVLLISAGDDRVWPSSEMSRGVVQRLAARRESPPCVHLDYPAAGHMIRLPHTPATTLESKHLGLGVKLAFGGTPEANARARVDAWQRTLEFLNEHLQHACPAGTGSF
ncbi:MAG: acyl-CoA thioester hydrolase/BAAT C-terminal domain-containing protein [Candidatus Acidiferrales bacterium]